MALLNLGDDPWLLEYDSCEKLYRDIMEQLTLRQRLPRITDNYSKVSAAIRLRLKQYNGEVDQLSQKLEAASKVDQLTAAESERRRRQIEVLHSKAVQIQKMFDDQMSTKAKEEREQLMGDSSWGPSTASAPQAVDYNQMKTTQQRLLGEQEQGLESLSQIISRQKNIASTISNEVDYHNEILDDLGTHMERTDTRVREGTQHIQVVSIKDKTCAYWVVIIVLFISIIVVATL